MPLLINPRELPDGHRISMPMSAARRLTLAFDDVPSAAHVGRRYLEQHPHEHDAARLVADIEAALESNADAVRCPGTARTALARQNSADFRAGHVVWLDGWLMGRTEARVCALATLQRGGPGPRALCRSKYLTDAGTSAILPSTRGPPPHARRAA